MRATWLLLRPTATSQIRLTISTEVNAVSPGTFVRFQFINFSEISIN